jgi:hypothetical protein
LIVSASLIASQEKSARVAEMKFATNLALLRRLIQQVQRLELCGSAGGEEMLRAKVPPRAVVAQGEIFQVYTYIHIKIKIRAASAQTGNTW